MLLNRRKEKVMLKKFAIYLICLSILCAPVLSHASEYNMNPVPFLGGGNSHEYFVYRTRTQTMSRYELVRMRRNMLNSSANNKMLELISSLASAIDGGWIAGVATSVLSSASNSSEDMIEDTLLTYTNESRRFRVTYKEWRSEVPKTGFLEITRIVLS